MHISERCILEYAFDAFIPLQWLVYPSELTETLNKPFHNLSRDNLASTLHTLFLARYIIAQRIQDDNIIYFSPDIQYIELALNHPFTSKTTATIAYGLTPQGGDAWEKEVQPDWNKYIYQYFEGLANNALGRGEIISTDQATTAFHLTQLKASGVPISGIISASEQWDTLHPWQATYWKALPTGYRVTFSYTDT